jgi:hypothetical protein
MLTRVSDRNSLNYVDLQSKDVLLFVELLNSNTSFKAEKINYV